MKQELYACVHAAEFPAQALLRLRTGLGTGLESQPVTVLDGRAPLETVCSLNRAAQLKGVSLGMTRLEAEGIPGLRILARSQETEAAARAVLLECAAHFSPRIEAASQGTACACVLDIAGTERLFGAPEILAQRLRATLASAGFRTSVAVSANFHAARFKAAISRGIAVIPQRQEAPCLAKLPIALLGLNEEHAETFAIWGIRTLGELAALAETDLVTRLGPQAAAWRHLALGALPHTFQPIEAEFTLKEFCDFDTPIDRTDSLLFMGARMIDCLVARAASHALSLASLGLHMELTGGLVYQRAIRPAIPTTERKFLLKLLQLEIAAHPPQAAVLSLTLTRPGSFRMESFAVASQSSTPECLEENRPRLALRRMRPPLSVRVQLFASKPVAFRDREQSFKVTAAYGPWRTSGCWWSADGWNAEEWDVLAETSRGSCVACLLVRNCTQNEWSLEAYYD